MPACVTQLLPAQQTEQKTVAGLLPCLAALPAAGILAHAATVGGFKQLACQVQVAGKQAYSQLAEAWKTCQASDILVLGLVPNGCANLLVAANANANLPG